MTDREESDRCYRCRRLRLASELQSGVCARCRLELPPERESPWAPRQAATPADRASVYVDASWFAGVAGLAVVGALGVHSRRVAAASSTEAECMAVRWAMEIAADRKRTNLTFLTDCDAAARRWPDGIKRYGFTVRRVPRRDNQVADRLASEARRGPTSTMP
jgi:ribonuclease HI